MSGAALTMSAPVTVDYDLPIMDAVRRGNFTEFSERRILSCTPFSNREGVARVVVSFYQFERCVSTEEVLRMLDEYGRRPAEFREVLAFCESHRIHDEHPIVVLGGIERGALCLSSHCGQGSGSFFIPQGQQILCLENIDVEWRGRCLFAAVQK